MDAIWQWGLTLIRAVQSVRGPALDAIFKGFTFLGEEMFFLIAFPPLLWCVDWAVGARVALLYLLSTYLNVVLKVAIGHPRPYVLDPMLRLHFRHTEGYGMPSGHAQSAVVVWGTLAAWRRQLSLWIAAILAMSLIGFSRIYLGVHFPTDVLAGWALGALLLAVHLNWGDRVEAWVRGLGSAWQIILAVAGPLGLLALLSVKDATTAMGVLMGVAVGLVLQIRLVHFGPDGTLRQCALRFISGIVPMFLLYFLLSVAFPKAGEPLYLPMRGMRYALIGLWVTLGAPWLFCRLGIASPKRQADPSLAR